ncbi:MAG: PKD domain-containing protein [Candidatus Aminicenantes bacterium]
MNRKYSHKPKVLWFMGVILLAAAVFASITYIPSNPQVGEEVIFTVIPPSGTILGSVEWDFGDGTIQELPPPTAKHKYMSPGTYTVKATYRTSTQLFPTDTQTVTVREERFISYSPADPRVHESVTFKAHNFLSNQIKWDFGDGNILTQGKQTAYHTYKNPGTYTVKAWDYYGQQGLPAVEAQVPVTPDLRAISYSPVPAVTDQEISFTASNFRSDCIKWDFGDGAIIEKGASMETHIYKKQGTYTVKAYDHCGQDKYPKSLTLNVLSRTGPAAPFQISFIQLRFEDGKSYQQVTKGFQPLLVYADMKYEGTGIFKAQWMVDGQTFQPVSRTLSAVGEETLSLGKKTPLPTQVPGIHEVTLNIIQPQVQYSIPKLRYFVSTGEIEKKVDVFISQVQDLEGNKIPLQRNRLSLSPNKHYLLSGIIQNLSENEIPSCLLQVSLEGQVVDQQKIKKLGPREERSFETSVKSDETAEQKLIFRVFDTPVGQKLLIEKELIVSSLPRPELMREMTPREGLRTLEGPPAPLEVLSPNGGEHYYKGGLYHIRWIGAEEIGDYVRVELLKDENLCLTIEDSTENDGVLSWLVPDHLETGYHLYRVRIESLSGDFMDESDREFFIFPEESEMRVVVPNGGETWYKESSDEYEGRACQYEIKWYAKGVGDKVNLELVRGSGPREGLLVFRIGQMDNDENLTIGHGRYTGTYNWTPPNDLLRGDYKIRVSGVAHPEVDLTDVNDESDTPFHIQESPSPITHTAILAMVEEESGGFGVVGCLPIDFEDWRSGPGAYNVSLDTYAGESFYCCLSEGCVNHSIRRGMASYDVSGIPSNATIESAILDLSKYIIEESDSSLHISCQETDNFPYNLGPLEVIQADYGEPSTSSAFFCDGIPVYFGLPGQGPDEPIDVTPSVQYVHRNGLSRWKIRIQFRGSDFNREDFIDEEYKEKMVYFSKGMDGCVLRVTYTYIPCEES